MSSSASRRSSTSVSNSKASKAQQNSIQLLQAENESLRREIIALQKIFSIPVDENHRYTHFRYQIYSLEKQVSLLTRLLDCKREAVATCETILLELNQFLQDFKGKITRKEHIDELLIQTWIDRIESNRKKSFKSMQDHTSLSDSDTLYAPNSAKFIHQEPIHLLDICSGKIEHLNLKNIANLESSLHNLHADLRSFQNELLDQTNHKIFPDLDHNLVKRSKELSNKINITTNELFYLSILVPTRHQKCSFAPEQITTDLICQRINSQFRLSPNIKLVLQSMIDSLICSYNHELHLLKLESNIKTKQLSFYRHSLANIHSQYIQNLIEILSTGQQSFNRQIQTHLYEPLVNVIKDFNRMNNEKTDESLKSFLFTFKIHIDQFNEVVHDLYQQITDGSKAVNQLFIETNEKMWSDIEKQQKKLLDDISLVKTEQIFTDDHSFDKLSQYFSNRLVCPLVDTVLDRFCLQILPQIHHKINWLNAESSSMERILLAADYHNLRNLGLYNVDEKTAERVFADESPLLHIFNNKKIQSLVITMIGNKTKTSASDFVTSIFTVVLSVFNNLLYLNCNPFAESHLRRLSFGEKTPTFFSLTLLELYVNVEKLNDCLNLLDGHLNQLRIFYVDIKFFNSPSEMIMHKTLLPNIIRFSLMQMTNLEKLALYISVEQRTFIDGNNLKNDIMNHLPKLNKSTSNMRSFIHNFDQTHLLSNEEIQHILTDLTVNQVISIHIRSLFDDRSFEHEIFVRIAQAFPLLEKLSMINRTPQNRNTKNKNEPLLIIEYHHLLELDFLNVNDDYLEQFLIKTKTYSPNNVCLYANYESLKRVTNCFRRVATRANAAKINSLRTYGQFQLF
ncbi:unnamed protein product [Rotaria socialis]|uniref:Uncharacterized protein n=1 Tax=Rotaria socialis TaxID=392032 RepID=A0A820PN46_9BILA|nr:unnamed protein product [Rotaria socialis]